MVRLLLEGYYEPRFADRSHGFRPGRGCHTALREVATTWTGTTWFIEGERRGERQTDDIEVHHVRKLSEVNTAGLANSPAWMQLMTRRRRKTLVVCRPCYATIHPGQPAIRLTQ